MDPACADDRWVLFGAGRDAVETWVAQTRRGARLDRVGAGIRIDRPAFFKNFVENHAVQYFYEPFLEAFDPELRKGTAGVWYTPPEIVEYMVARVDTVLREESSESPMAWPIDVLWCLIPAVAPARIWSKC